MALVSALEDVQRHVVERPSSLGIMSAISVINIFSNGVHLYRVYVEIFSEYQTFSLTHHQRSVAWLHLQYKIFIRFRDSPLSEQIST